MRKKRFFGAYIQPDVLERFDAVCRELRRTRSNTLEIVLQRFVDEWAVEPDAREPALRNPEQLVPSEIVEAVKEE